MLYTLHELSCKDVINLCDGKMLGRITDLEFENDCGKMTAVYLGNNGFWLSSREEIRIPWCDIRCIGEDAVLVEYHKEVESCKKPHRMCGWWTF